MKTRKWKKILTILCCIFLLGNIVNVFAVEEEVEEEIEESTEEQKGGISLIFFGECGYTLGYAAKGGLEDAVKNGKLFLEPLLIGEVAIQGIGGEWSVCLGGEMINIKPMEWWEKTYYEKNFRWDTFEIHIGVNPGLFKFDKYQTKNITVGLRSISLTPPEFNPYKLQEEKILEEQKRFIEEESVWGKETKKSGIEIGYTRIKKSSGDKSYLKLAIFYIDDRIGFKISSHGAHYGLAALISITTGENLIIYFSPASILGSFDFTWWYERGWYFNYSLLGFYF